MTAGIARPFVVVSPGRVNLIGEHTDYNDGFVLPLAIDRGLRIAVCPRAGRTALVSSEGRGAAVQIDLSGRLTPGRTDWGRYVEGVVAGYRRLGWEIPAFEAVITADLPVGGGLSSSAALEVGMATAVEALCGRQLTTTDKALLCQRAEHEFAGVPCGIMDQFAVAFGRMGHALLLDCRSGEVRWVPLAPEIAVLVIDSGVQHELADSGYAARRLDCETAAKLLGKPALRDVSPVIWTAREASLPEPARRRGRHVIEENARVLSVATAAASGDWAAVGRLMEQSHASLRDDFQVSCRELDLICSVAGSVPGVFGCRLTGGGFGGCAVAVIESVRASAIAAEVQSRCAAVLGGSPAVFVTAAAAGARVIDG